MVASIVFPDDGISLAGRSGARGWLCCAGKDPVQSTF